MPTQTLNSEIVTRFPKLCKTIEANQNLTPISEKCILTSTPEN